MFIQSCEMMMRRGSKDLILLKPFLYALFFMFVSVSKCFAGDLVIDKVLIDKVQLRYAHSHYRLEITLSEKVKNGSCSISREKGVVGSASTQLTPFIQSIMAVALTAKSTETPVKIIADANDCSSYSGQIITGIELL